MSAHALTLQVTGPPSPGVAYFAENFNTTWNYVSSSTSPYLNWSSDKAGLNAVGNIPGANTDVILAATNLGGGALTTNLGQNMTINSLNVINPGANTISADGNALTLMALVDSNTASDGSYNSNNGNPAGAGISIYAGAGPVTINPPVNLGNGQTWTNSSGSLLTVAGNVAGTAALGSTQTLTLVNAGSGATTISGAIGDGPGGGLLAVLVNNTGTGVTTLSGTSTYSGGTTLTAGTLTLGNVYALGAGGLTVNGGQLNLAAGTLALPALSGGGGTITSGSAAMLNIGSGTYGGTIANGAGTIALVKNTGGTLALTGTNYYSGGTTLAGGVLEISGTANLGTPGGYALTFNGGTLQLLGPLAEGRNYTVAVNQNAAINTAGYALTMSGNLTTSATNAGLYATGGGTLTLSGSNVLSGAATDNNGVLNLNGSLVTGGSVQAGYSANSVGVLNASGSLTAAGVVLGNAAGASGTLTLTGSLNSTAAVNVGNAAGAVGTLNLTTGTLNSTAAVNVGNGAGSSGTLNVSGILTTAGLAVGNGSLAVGAFSQTGGSVTVNGGGDGALAIGNALGSTGSYTMSGGSLNRHRRR